jgi:NitT/TauT family transport system substrate-binding protein
MGTGRARRWVRAVGAAVVGGALLWLVACGGTPGGPPATKPAASGPTPAAASQPGGGAAGATAPASMAAPARVPIQYGSISKTAWDWHRIVAINKGLFEREGLDAEWVLFRTPPNGAQLFTAGALDVGGINPETVIRSVVNGAPITMVGSDQNLAPYSFIVQGDLKTWSDLRGKTFPISGPREQTTIWLRSMLMANGLRESDFDFVVAGATPERMAAIRSGAVAGGLVGQPLDFELMRIGFNRLAVLAEYIPDHPLGVHAARNDYLQEHPDRAKATLRAVRDGVRWLYDPANKQEAVAMLARETEVPEQLAVQTYELLIEQLKLWNSDLNITPATVQKSLDFLLEVGELSAPLPPAERFLDRRYIEEANRGG